MVYVYALSLSKAASSATIRYCLIHCHKNSDICVFSTCVVSINVCSLHVLIYTVAENGGIIASIWDVQVHYSILSSFHWLKCSVGHAALIRNANDVTPRKSPGVTGRILLAKIVSWSSWPIVDVQSLQYPSTRNRSTTLKDILAAGKWLIRGLSKGVAGQEEIPENHTRYHLTKGCAYASPGPIAISCSTTGAMWYLDMSPDSYYIAWSNE